MKTYALKLELATGSQTMPSIKMLD